MCAFHYRMVYHAVWFAYICIHCTSRNSTKRKCCGLQLEGKSKICSKWFRLFFRSLTHRRFDRCSAAKHTWKGFAFCSLEVTNSSFFYSTQLYYDFRSQRLRACPAELVLFRNCELGNPPSTETPGSNNSAIKSVPVPCIDYIQESSNAASAVRLSTCTSSQGQCFNLNCSIRLVEPGKFWEPICDDPPVMTCKRVGDHLHDDANFISQHRPPRRYAEIFRIQN